MAIADTAVGFWQAKNYSGSGDWLDESGNGYDLTIEGSPTHTSPYFVMDGLDDYFHIADTADFDFADGQAFTIMVVGWQADRTPSGQLSWITKRVGNPSSGLGWAIWQTTGGVITSGVGDASATRADTFADSPPESAVFSIAMVYNQASGDDLEAFLDGTGTGTPADMSALGTLEATQKMVVGGSAKATVDGFIVGRIYAVAIWRSALSDADVATAHTELTDFSVASTGGHAMAWKPMLRPGVEYPEWLMRKMRQSPSMAAALVHAWHRGTLKEPRE